MTACDANQRVADVMITGGQPIQAWAPAYFFFNGPYVIEDYAHFDVASATGASRLGDAAIRTAAEPAIHAIKRLTVNVNFAIQAPRGRHEPLRS